MSYGQKKGWESKCHFDSWPLKVGNHPNLFACKWHATYCWKNFQWRLQLFFRPHLDQRSAKEVMGPQSCRNLNFRNFGTPNLGVSGQNDIWVLALWPSTKNTMRGKVVASRKSGPWWVLWLCVCLWLVRAPKVLQLYTNQLVVWFVQVRVNNWFAWSLFLVVPIPELQHTPLPPKCYDLRNVPQLLLLSLFSPLDLQLNLLKSLGVRQIPSNPSSKSISIFDFFHVGVISSSSWLAAHPSWA
jgi:hypothetical protein